MTGSVFVTGAAGFIGRRVLRALLERGDRVVATDVAQPREGFGQELDFYVADIRDVTRHASVIARGCDRIIHCGGISGPMLLLDNPAEVLDINIRGTAQLLELASSLDIARFVSLSSVSAYGNTPAGMDVVDESAPLGASTFYGTSKAASDLVLQTYAARGLVDAIALRVGWVYGPGRMTDAIIQPIVRSANGAPYHLEAGGDHLIQFVHIDDMVAAILAALDAKSHAQTAYNINGEQAVRVASIFDQVRRELPAIDAGVGPGLLPDTDVQGRMSIDAAARDLGWHPRISFEEGLSDNIAWLRRHAPGPA